MEINFKKASHSIVCLFCFFRYERIKQKFMTAYGVEPEFYARAPGRVNLIGKYCLLSLYQSASTEIYSEISLVCQL